ncbi:MAG: transaldolase [Phycisphaerae bacterium]|nr:transaldolase [Phycisphaerae bacterium]
MTAPSRSIVTARLHQVGQSLWLDNITRAMLDSGTLQKYINDLSVTGLTSNPTIFEKAVSGSGDYDAQLRTVAARTTDPEAIFFELAIADLTRAADLFRPVHDRTAGVDGFVSLEVSPKLANDTAATIAQAKSLFAKANRKNLYIKVPGTREGVPAIEELIYAGIPINVTLLFSKEQYLAAADAYLRGIERRVAEGKSANVSSVASLFVSRWDRATSAALPPALQNKTGIAVAQVCYKEYLDLISSSRFLALEAKGAFPQRLLYASTGTKDPALKATMYLEALASPNTVNTIPEETLLAFAQQGTLGDLVPTNGLAAQRVLDETTKAGVDLAAVAEKLQLEGRDSFIKSWKDLIAVVEKRAGVLVTR